MKEKIIEWLDVDSPPILAKDSVFVEADKKVNKITVRVGQEHNGKTMQLLIGQNSLDATAKFYEGNITEGWCSFILEGTETLRGVYKIYIRILEADKTYAACTVSYQVECGKIFDKIIPPGPVQDEADKIIKELKEVIAAANDSKARLETTVRTADTTKTNLQHVIDIATAAEDGLTAATTTATTATQELNTKVTEANRTKGELITEINKVPGKIVELQQAGDAEVLKLNNSSTDNINKINLAGAEQLEKINQFNLQDELQVRDTRIPLISVSRNEENSETALIYDTWYLDTASNILTASRDEKIAATTLSLETSKYYTLGEIVFNNSIKCCYRIGDVVLSVEDTVPSFKYTKWTKIELGIQNTFTYKRIR